MPSKRRLRALAAVMCVYLLASCQRRAEEPLAIGHAVHGELRGGETRSWTVNAQPGDLIELNLLQDERRALRIELAAPDGDRIFQRKAGSFLYEAIVAGPYRVNVDGPAVLDPPARFEVQRLTGRGFGETERRELRARRRLRILIRDDDSPDPVVRADMVRGMREVRAEFAVIGLLDRVGDVDYELSLIAEADGDLTEASRLAMLATKEFDEADDRIGQCDAHELVGSLAMRRGRREEAMPHFDTQLAIARELNDPRREGNAHMAVAQVLLDRGDFGGSIAALERAAERYSVEANDGSQLYGVTLTLGAAYQKSGDADLALEYAARAEQLARARGAELEVSKAVANRGFVYLQSLDDPATALRAFEEAELTISGFPLEHANLLEAIAGAKLALGRAPEALADVDRALLVVIGADVPQQLAELRITRGRVLLALGRPEAAADLEAGLALARAVGAEQFAVRAQLGLALAARAAGDVATTRARLEDAIAGLEQLRSQAKRVELRTTFFGVVRQTYDTYLDLLWTEGDTSAAFAASERARARQLLDAVSPGQVTALPPVIGEREALNRLDSGSATIELAVTDARTLVWRFEAGRVEHFELSGRRTLAPLVREWHAALAARGEHPEGELPGVRHERIAEADRRAAVAGAALGEALAPLFAGITARRVVIVPDGTLFLVPWAALPAPGGGRLLDGHEVAIAPSLTWLARRRDPRPPRPSGALRLAVLADPILSTDPRTSDVPVLLASRDRPLTRLVGSRQEAEAIAGLLPAGDVRLALDGDASLATLRSPEVRNARILHLATHAVVDDRRSDRSHLVLSTHDAGGRPIDGELDVAGIAALGGNHELVVLSACRSALGREIRGEGLVGLAHAFLASGASGVVASLWPVEDGPTAMLMTEMYKAMLNDGLPAAAALAAAQRRIAAEPRWASPYYWAGFVVLGDPRVGS